MIASAILRRVRGIHGTCGALAVATVLALAPPALAQNDDGVYVNPNSPSGVEYDFPLERARRDAAGSDAPGAPVAQGEQSSAPFGEGITPRAGRASAGSATGSKRGGSARAAKGSAKPPPEVVEAAARPVAAPGGSGSTLLYGGLGAVVIAAGALAGLAFRRRS